MKTLTKAALVLAFSALYPFMLLSVIAGVIFETVALGFEHGRLKFYTMLETLQTPLVELTEDEP